MYGPPQQGGSILEGRPNVKGERFMKALYFNEHGGPEVLHCGDVADPAPPGPGKALLRVRSCALNHLDIWVRRGWPGLKLGMPHWGGSDIAGEIIQLGGGVTGWREGQRVVVDPGFNLRSDEHTRRGEDSVSGGYHILGENCRGGLAEYILVDAEHLHAMPDHLDFPAAAAPLLVSLTAWRMLMKRAVLRPGETILIVGAGGGVNTMATQIARLAGATVYVVASNAAKAAKAAELGADVVLDRSQVDWEREVFHLTNKRGVDVVVDNVGAATLNTSMRVAARGGRIVIVGNTSGPRVEIDIRYLFGKQISLIGSTMGSHQDFLDVTALLWARRLIPVVDAVLPLSRGIEAFAMMERSDQFGKIVLEP
jgi:NADPH:quinone reductase-like Zn-dependent oxidoreductase